MNRSLLKYLALTLLFIYQINVSHHLFTTIGHDLIHLIEDHIRHTNHHKHEHDSKHLNDHGHHILYSFDESFTVHSDHPITETEKSTLIRLNFDKHLFNKIILLTTCSFDVKFQFEFILQKIVQAFTDIQTPPPRK